MYQSKENRIKVLKLFLFLLLFMATLILAARILDWKDTTGNYLSSTSQLYHTPKNTMDVVFMGSSHCYCSIYPSVLWREAGIAAFDMAVSGQDKNSTYYTLIETLKTQSPKVVFVDMYGLLFDKNVASGNSYRNMLSLKPSLNSLKLIREYVEPEEQLSYIIRWPIIHTRFWELDKYDFIAYEPSIYGRGADYQWVVGQAERGKDGTETTGVLKYENQQWLERLRDLSRKQKFDLVFFVAPFPVSEEEQQQINAAQVFADQNHIDFIDFNKLRDELGLDDQQDFIDSFHCNAFGAEKTTAYIMEYLLQHYTLEDHRDDNRYSFWELDYKWYLHQQFSEYLLPKSEMKERLRLLKSQEDVLSIISVDLSIVSKTDGEYFKLVQSLKELGLTAEELRNGGKWLLLNGKLTKMIDNVLGEEYIRDISDSDTLRIRYTRSGEPSDVRINYTDYLSSSASTTIVIYDLFQKKVLEILEF